MFEYPDRLENKAKVLIGVISVMAILVTLSYAITEYEEVQKYINFKGWDGEEPQEAGDVEQAQMNGAKQVTTEIRRTVTKTVSNPEGLNDLSCQNLEDVIGEFLTVMEASIMRVTTGNQTHYWVSYDIRGAGGGAEILQVYLTLYQMNDCPYLEYPIIRDLVQKRTDIPESQQSIISVLGSPVFTASTGSISVTLVNSGTMADTISSISTVINGTRLTVSPSSGASIQAGGAISQMTASFGATGASAGVTYQFRIAFESGNQLSLQVIASLGGSQNQADQSAIAIETVTFSGTTATVYFRNVGSVSITPALLTAQGMSSNSGFTGTATNSTSLTSGSLGKGLGSSNALTLSGLTSGDIVTFKITTTAGTFAQSTYTVP